MSRTSWAETAYAAVCLVALFAAVAGESCRVHVDGHEAGCGAKP